MQVMDKIVSCIFCIILLYVSCVCTPAQPEVKKGGD